VCDATRKGCKIPQKELLKLLEGVGSGIGMDCSVTPSHKYPDLFVVSTTDFFFPLVEDPYEQGRIACCNVLSDMYAMGIDEIDNVLMLLAAGNTDFSPFFSSPLLLLQH
jgi:selenide,water dikinase